MVRWSAGSCGGHLLMGQGDTTQGLHGKAINLLHISNSSSLIYHSTHLYSTVLQSMLTLITDKLQNQSLDDSAASISPSQKPAFFKPPLPKDDVITKPSTSQALSVKGKNVWSVPFETSVSGWSGKGENPSSSRSGKICDKNLTKTGQQCYHRNSMNGCMICDNHCEVDPPKKKHCRSLSVPIDSMRFSPCPPEGPRLWRPIAVIPLTNNNIDKQNRNLTHRLSELRPSCRNTSFSRYVPSPLSMDSGHCTTSDFQTPPISPVPRPASALSNFSQGSSSVPWLEQSPQKINRFEILKNRSLSQEEQTRLGSTPCMFDSMYSNPSSPYKHKIPRCRSQPCVLHDRKYAKKRRRDDCRPTLNFQKMTETAYSRMMRSRPVSVTAGIQRPSSSFHDDLEDAVNLMPIASSPRSSDIATATSSEVSEAFADEACSLRATPPTPAGDYSDYDIQQPVRLIGDDDTESGCGCRGDDLEDEGELFPLADLDIEQIENH